MLFGSYQVDNMDPATVSPSNWSYLRVYSLTISDGEGLKYDLVPCRDTDNAFGLYDKLSGRIVYSNTSTAFGGGVAPEDVYEDDPTVIETLVATTYEGDFTGTGENRLVFTGKGRATLEGSASQFKSVAVDFGTVRFNQLAGALLTEGDAVVRRGCADYIPLKNTSADAVASLATDGSVTYGPVAEITLNRNSCKSATLNLGNLVREAGGGTLLLKLGSDSVASLGGVLKLFAEGYAEGEILPATIVSGKPADNNGAKFRFLQYTAAGGLVPAPMTEGFGGGASAIASVSADTTLSESAAVKGLVVEFGKKLTMGDGVTLTVGDGTNPAGVILADNGSATVYPLSGGTIDFGDSEGVIWGSPCYNSKTINLSKGTVIKGNKGVTFTTRVDGAGGNRARFNALPASGAVWSGPTHIEGCYYNGELPRDATSGDIFVEGNANYGASLFVGGKTFNNKVHLAGPGQGADKWYALWTEGSGHANFNGEVELMADTTVYSHNSSNTLKFNGPVTGAGGFLVRTQSGGSGIAYFETTNTYAGITRIYPSATIQVEGKGTLGQGAVDLQGRLTFYARNGYAVTNRIDGASGGELKLSAAEKAGSVLDFTNTVDVSKLAFSGPDIYGFSGKTRVGAINTGRVAELQAKGENAELRLAGTGEWSTTAEIRKDEGAAYDLVKEGDSSVLLSAAATARSVTVEGGTLKLGHASVLTDTASMCFWLDASDATTVLCEEGTTRVTNWVSKVGTARFVPHAVLFPTATPKTYPQYGTTKINGLDSMTIARNTTGGAGRARMGETTQTFDPRMVFIVAKPTSVYQYMGLFGKWHDDVGLRWGVGQTLYSRGYGDYNGAMWVDGKRGDFADSTPIATGSTHLITATRIGSGSYAFCPGIGGYKNDNREFQGQICEVIAFSRILEPGERKEVEAYLAKKWGVTGEELVEPQLLGTETALTVAEGATLDLNGRSAVIDTIDGTGAIVNSSGKKVTLKVKNSGTFNGTVGDDVELKLKQGFLLLIR